MLYTQFINQDTLDPFNYQKQFCTSYTLKLLVEQLISRNLIRVHNTLSFYGLMEHNYIAFDGIQSVQLLKFIFIQKCSFINLLLKIVC